MIHSKNGFAFFGARMLTLRQQDYNWSGLCGCNFHGHEMDPPEEHIGGGRLDPSMKPAEVQNMKKNHELVMEWVTNVVRKKTHTEDTHNDILTIS